MILHLDMDAFFAAIEALDNPALKGVPLIVGGGDRGVVATASYEARVYGIHSAMPVATARKLCPHGVFIHGSHGRYSEVSRKLMACLRKFSRLVQPASIDEAYLDMRGRGRTYGDYEKIALAIKREVASATGGLTCSIGLAPAKFLAKICSDINKPDGIFILMPEEVDGFLLALDVDKLPGVGKSMAASLRAFGVTSVGGLRALSREFLLGRYGKWGAVLHDRARGIDPREVHENPPPKSEGSERTFSKDTFDRNALRDALDKHARRVGKSLQANGGGGRTITVKIKFSDFRVITRSRTIGARTASASKIFEVACSILDNVVLPRPVRLIGLSVTGFDFRPEQLVLPGIAALRK